MKSQKTYGIFGEVLFDIFPDGQQILGGAPFNVAWHLQALGQKPHFISCVGDDNAGRSIRSTMSEWGMETRFLQTDKTHPTGRVTIHIKNGEPQYTIVPNCAYDFIPPPKHPITKAYPLLYHGTLALRNPVSAQTLVELKRQFKGILFMDVNLRIPFWTQKSVLALIQEADWVKLNEAELRKLDSGKLSLIKLAQDFRKKYALKGLVVTQGEVGALAVTETSAPIQVKASKIREHIDTVGAGDAFCAVLLLGITNDWPLKTTMKRASDFAARVVENHGALIHTPRIYQALRQDWQLET